jgi:hypothetical protein
MVLPLCTSWLQSQTHTQQMTLLVNNDVGGLFTIPAMESTKHCKPATAAHVSMHLGWGMSVRRSNIHQRGLLLLLLLSVCRYIEISRGALATPAVGKQHAELLPNATGEAHNSSHTHMAQQAIVCKNLLCWLLFTA